MKCNPPPRKVFSWRAISEKFQPTTSRKRGDSTLEKLHSYMDFQEGETTVAYYIPVVECVLLTHRPYSSHFHSSKAGTAYIASPCAPQMLLCNPCSASYMHMITGLYIPTHGHYPL